MSEYTLLVSLAIPLVVLVGVYVFAVQRGIQVREAWQTLLMITVAGAGYSVIVSIVRDRWDIWVYHQEKTLGIWLGVVPLEVVLFGAVLAGTIATTVVVSERL